MTAATAGPSDRGIAHAVAEPAALKATRHPAATLAATILGSSLAFIDSSVVNVGLPAIQRNLGAGGAQLSWLINAYLLPLGAAALIGCGLCLLAGLSALVLVRSEGYSAGQPSKDGGR